MRQCRRRDHQILLAIADAAVVLAPSHLTSIGVEVRAAQVMVMTHLGATDAGEEAFRLIGAGALRRVCVLVVDALREEDRMEFVPMGGFVGVNRGVRRHALRDRLD